MPTLRCGFIGLGAMGAPMARHLHSRGLLAVVGNRGTAKATALATELQVRGATAPAAFSGCNAVLLCVSADADVLQNVDALAAVLQPGAIVVDHSTVARATALDAARRLGNHGIGFVDAPVSGGVEGARNGRLSVMAGGAAEHVDRVRPALDAYAARVTHLGGVGDGQAAKAVNQVLVAGINEAVCEGLALAERLGLDPARLIPTLGAGAAANWFLDKRGATMLRDEFAVGFKLALLHKDLKIVRGLALEAGTDRSVIEKSLADYAVLLAQGHGEEDISALIRLKRGR